MMDQTQPAATINAMQSRIDTLEAENARLTALVGEMAGAARVLDDHYQRNICFHESTHRGGAIWTICDDCGRKWADDEGGFIPFKFPIEVKRARAALAKHKEVMAGD